MNYKLDKKKFDDIYFEGKPMYDKVKVVHLMLFIVETINQKVKSFWVTYESILKNL